MLKEKIASAPDLPGVYLMRDARGKVIYVGKARSLKKRLATYLGGGLSDKTAALMNNVSSLEFVLLPNESMALLAEAGFIHRFNPKYNIALRDDKSFPFVKISAEDFPFLSVTRKKDDPRASYIGPYTNVKLLKDALKIIRHSFPYRSCARLPGKICIYGRIGLCPAPCAGSIGKIEYSRRIADITMILKGEVDVLVNRLSRAMQDKAGEKDFEEAARIRDQISTLAELSSGLSGVNRKGELEDLRKDLGLDRSPERIEGFDISNISGKQAVGSMVSFYRGNPDKNNYRRFRIKWTRGIDDCRMIAELVYRRYSRLIREKRDLPDLLLIDGGKGQLASAVRQIKELGLDIPVVSIAKKEERIYNSRNNRVLTFSRDTPALNLIRRVRDEAHRFAVRYHLLLRRKELIGR
ncbi:MAG: excinuclease ABC subunit UvrC [Candidatus Omnitrophica bacterium]|nr:excinuclease ABC subunit UvrC [Candidatus Omnitrophota bacterium]